MATRRKRKEAAKNPMAKLRERRRKARDDEEADDELPAQAAIGPDKAE